VNLRQGTSHPGPQLVVRGARSAVETDRDLEVVAWIARFRFVTADVLAERFAVSEQAMRRRLRGLARAGWIGLEREHRTQANAAFVTARGARLLGQRPRRAPRTQVQREHELALAWLCARLEVAGTGLVMTEREGRACEADGGPRCSADVAYRTGGPTRRWPDLIVTHDDRRIAIEVEFAPKDSPRLRRILNGYRRATWFQEARFLVRSPALAVRLEALIEATRADDVIADLFDTTRLPQAVVAAWPGAAPQLQRRIRVAIAQAQRR